nr:hypothetical protein [Actinomycetales bacterium]
MRMNRPVLWRRQGEVQLGAAPWSTRLEGLGDDVCDLLLDVGAGRHRTAADAAARGIDRAHWAELTARAAEELRLPAPLPRPTFRPVPLDHHALTRSVVAGLDTLGGAATAEMAVLTDWYVTDPVRVRPLMRNDRPFLPLVIDDDGATVGPPVHPGRTSCPRCLDLARADDDPCWPAVATQLRLLLPGRLDPMVVRLASAAAVLEIGAGEGWGWRISAEGIARFRVEPHNACGCLTPDPEQAPLEHA